MLSIEKMSITTHFSLPVLYETRVCKINWSINTNNYNSIIFICFRILFNIPINSCSWQTTQNSCSEDQTIMSAQLHILQYLHTRRHTSFEKYTLVLDERLKILFLLVILKLKGIQFYILKTIGMHRCLFNNHISNSFSNCVLIYTP